MRRQDFEVWEDKFQPMTDKDGDWQRFDVNEPSEWGILKNTDKKFIWTVVDGDNGKLYLTPGYRIVNRLHYHICKNPHKFDKTRDFKY